MQLWFCTGASLPSLCGESPSARDPHSEPHLRSVKNFALVCVSGPLRDGLGARQLAFRLETHYSPVAKKDTVRTHTHVTLALHSDAPHTTVDTTAHHRAHVTQRANTHVCARQQLTHDTRDFIHSFIQQLHSTHARHAHARVKRESHHTRCTQERLFSSVVNSTFAPFLLCVPSSAARHRYVCRSAHVLVLLLCPASTCSVYSLPAQQWILFTRQAVPQEYRFFRRLDSGYSLYDSLWREVAPCRLAWMAPGGSH